MEEMYNTGIPDVKPQAVTYAKTALAWVNSNSDNAAENAIEHLEALKTLTGPGVQQEFETMYQKVLDLLSRREQSVGASKTDELLDRLQRLRTELCGEQTDSKTLANDDGRIDNSELKNNHPSSTVGISSIASG